MVELIIFLSGSIGLVIILLLILINIKRQKRIKPVILVCFIIFFSFMTGIGAFFMQQNLKKVVIKNNENNSMKTVNLDKGQEFTNQVSIDLSIEEIKNGKQNITVTFINNDKICFDGRVYLEMSDEKSSCIFEEKYDIKLNPQGKSIEKINLDKKFRVCKYKVIKN